MNKIDYVTCGDVPLMEKIDATSSQIRLRQTKIYRKQLIRKFGKKYRKNFEIIKYAFNKQKYFTICFSYDVNNFDTEYTALAIVEQNLPDNWDDVSLMELNKKPSE